jgi:hypothetical protein
MAAVYRAYQPGVDRTVALKILPRHYAADPEFVARFEREARLIARLEHPHIMPVHDFGEADGYTYLAMRFVESGTLADLLEKGQPLSLAQMQRVVGQVGDALDYAHSQGVIHRDIKPSNILIDKRGNCLLTDFGIAKMMEGDTHLTRTGGVIGTPAYMSPEQITGQPLDGRSDMYSLGIVLYEMATGRVPYQAETPPAVLVKHLHDPLPLPRGLNPALPESVERVILKSLAKQPQDRYATLGDMVRALQAALPAAPDAGAKTDIIAPTPTAEGTGEKATEPARRRQGSRRLWPWLIGGLAVAGVTLVLAVSAAVLAPKLFRGGGTAATSPAGAILFQDDFSSNVHAWPVGEKSDDYSSDVSQVADGKYRRSTTSKRDVLWQEAVPGISPQDFWLGVEATLVETSAEGGDANVSLIFRKDQEGNYYRVRFDNNGRYIFTLRYKGEWLILQDWRFNSDIRLEPGVVNTLAVQAKGTQLSVYANGQELTTLTDTRLSGPGKVGLGIGLDQADQTLTVDFDNLIIKDSR